MKLVRVIMAMALSVAVVVMLPACTKGASKGRPEWETDGGPPPASRRGTDSEETSGSADGGKEWTGTGKPPWAGKGGGPNGAGADGEAD